MVSARKIAFDEEKADLAFELVTGKAAPTWEHHWREDRNGPKLVERIPEIDALIGRLSIRLTHSPIGCFYAPHSDIINIPATLTFFNADGQSATSAFYAVIFHEVVHWTAKRVSRPAGASWFGTEEYAQEELVAELGAIMLMLHYGVDIGAPERHAFYFQHWLERAGYDREEALDRARIEAEKAVSYILNV